jgi:hypothetical protein
MKHFTFNELASALRDREKRWTAKSSSERPSHFVRSGNNVQYFVLDDATKGEEATLPAVVLVGINYTQEPTAVPGAAVVDRQNPNPRTRLKAAYTHLCINTTSWFDCALAPWSNTSSIPLFPERYHLVLTNLSPWITTRYWQSDMCKYAPARGGQLIAQPPYIPRHAGWPYDHLQELCHSLELKDSWWIGHGRDSVWPRWHSIARGLDIGKWLLVGNLFARTFEPARRSDGTIKFG